MAVQIFGIPVSRGVAIGRAVLLTSARLDVDHYFVEVDRVEAEVDRLRQARAVVREELDTLRNELPDDAPSELAAFIDVHKMLLEDPQIGHETAAWIRQRRYNAEWALTTQLEVVARSFDEMDDSYLRERKADVEQVVERLLHALAGSDGVRGAGHRSAADRDADELVLVAHDIAPADMLQFKQGVFRGFVTDVGGKTSHTAIVARSLDIPAVVGAREASRLIRQDDWVVIDGDSGIIIVDPSPAMLEDYRWRKHELALGRERLKRLKRTPARTLDGHSIELLANIEMPEDCASALDSGSVGVGLFRTEFLFMNRADDLPGEDEQYEAYCQVLRTMTGLPVTIRTIDIGADKPLDGDSSALNPALGLRAIRYSLSDPTMFRVQLRALLRASAHGPLRILIPMLAHASEIQQTFAQLQLARAELEAAGQLCGVPEIGAMIEIPGAVLMLPLFLRYFDFISVGTNDLVQYTLAIDRADESVAQLYDPLHPAVLQLLARTLVEAEAARTWKGRAVHCSVCGEMAGDPALTRLLLGLGLRSFSMHPAQLLAVKQEILRADCSRLAPLAQAVLGEYEPEAQQRALAALLN